jgi:D-beta-D-heptose 7-phosphate kinase/D-beta-D-heptose 1-phosphate adenosyltransferase
MAVSCSLTKKGNIMPKGIFSPHSSFSERYIPDYVALTRKIEALRELGQKIVLTQGVYDLLHIGHVRYLEAAKAEGDILVVAVDSDALTKKRKGPNRPIVPEQERLEMLAGVRCVDIITIRDVHHGINDSIFAIKPDVLITSETTADFSEETKRTLEEHCGKIMTLPAQATISTTARLRNLAIDGAQDLADKIKEVIENHMRVDLESEKPSVEKKKEAAE